jgi:hypothetical protein
VKNQLRATAKSNGSNYKAKIKRGKTMQQISSAAHDGNPAHPVTMSATFTLDVQDPSDHQTAAAVASAFNARQGSATITVTNPDPGTVLIQVVI